MSKFSAALLWWTPRLVGSLIALLFCYVIIDEGLPPRSTGAIGIDIVAAIVTVLVALGWRWAWFGTAGFGLMAVVFGTGPFLAPYLGGNPNPKGAFIATALFLLVALLYWRSWKRHVGLRQLKAGEGMIA